MISASLAASLLLPAAARAHGDPVTERLFNRSLFIPPASRPDPDVVRQLATVVRQADHAGFEIKVALVARRSDLGPRHRFFRKPQLFAEFVSTDLAAFYEGGVLVVMPNGFGYAVEGRSRQRFRRELIDLPRPGRDVTKQGKVAAVAVRHLALADDVQLSSPTTTGGGTSEARDRLTIAAAATAGIALIAGVVLLRRGRRERPS